MKGARKIFMLLVSSSEFYQQNSLPFLLPIILQRQNQLSISSLDLLLLVLSLLSSATGGGRAYTAPECVYSCTRGNKTEELVLARGCLRVWPARSRQASFRSFPYQVVSHSRWKKTEVWSWQVASASGERRRHAAHEGAERRRDPRAE